MFRIGSRGLWTLDVLSARPIQLGQQVCTVGGCGEATDRDKANYYVGLLTNILEENPGCFQGEDLEYAQAILGKLQSFLSLPAGARGSSMTAVSDDEMKIISQAQGCKRVYLTHPGPETGTPAPATNDTRQPIPIQQTLQPGQPVVPGAQADDAKSNLVPAAIGAAGALALIYALVH